MSYPGPRFFRKVLPLTTLFALAACGTPANTVTPEVKGITALAETPTRENITRATPTLEQQAPVVIALVGPEICANGDRTQKTISGAALSFSYNNSFKDGGKTTIYIEGFTPNDPEAFVAGIEANSSTENSIKVEETNNNYRIDITKNGDKNADGKKILLDVIEFTPGETKETLKIFADVSFDPSSPVSESDVVISGIDEGCF